MLAHISVHLPSQSPIKTTKILTVLTPLLHGVVQNQFEGGVTTFIRTDDQGVFGTNSVALQDNYKHAGVDWIDSTDKGPGCKRRPNIGLR